MPEGELVTNPVPVPARVTVKGTPEVELLKVAVTEFAAFTVTAQAAVPEQGTGPNGTTVFLDGDLRPGENLGADARRRWRAKVIGPSCTRCQI